MARVLVQQRTLNPPLGLATLAALRARFAQAMHAGSVRAELGPREDEAGLTVTLNAPADRRFFVQARRRLEHMLRESGPHVTLELEDPEDRQLKALRRFVERLERYGEQVWLRIDAAFYRRLAWRATRMHVITEADAG